MLKHDARTYTTWIEMRRRCRNQSRKDYARYGGRGIKVCPEWEHSFQAFFRDMGPRPNGMILDRMDNDMGYDKNNCRWVTPRQSGNNQRSNRRIVYSGQTRTLSEWASHTGIPAITIAARLDRFGWSIKSALETPVNENRRGRTVHSVFLECGGVVKSLKQWSKECGIKYSTLWRRVKIYGMSGDSALRRV